MRHKLTALLLFVPQFLMAQTGQDADGGYPYLFLAAAIIAYFAVMLWDIRRKMQRLNKPIKTLPESA